MKLPRFLVSLAFAGLVSSANATVLTFEGLTSASAVGLNSAVTNYGGFAWSSDFVLFDTASYGAPVHSGSYGVINNFGASPVGLTVVASSTFDFTGVWLGGWTGNTPATVTIEGYDTSNTLVNSITVNDANNTIGYVSANFSGISSLKFVGGQYFTFDDFTFNQNTNTVPVPGTLALIAAAICAAGMTRRKRAA